PDHHRHMPPARSFVVYRRQRHRSLNPEPRVELWILHLLLVRLAHALEEFLVPKLKVIAPRREHDFAIEMGELAQDRRNQNAALAINRDLESATDIECLEGLHVWIEARLVAYLVQQLLPIRRRKKLEARFAIEIKVGDVKAIVAFAGNSVTEACRNTD